MAIFYETIPKSLIQWILDQKMFCVATSPLSARGHVNVSPKGGSYFGVPDERSFWYMDMSGSGIETISHLHEPGNGRITIMFSAFEGPPKIVRLWGKGQVLENGTEAFDRFVAEHDITPTPGTRSIITVDVHQVGSSCGWSVPFYDFVGFRPVLNDFWERRAERFKAGNAEESMDRYWAYKNAWSVDGLPAMKRGLRAGRVEHVEPIKKMVGPSAPKRYRMGYYTVEQVVLIAVACLVVGILLGVYGQIISQNMLKSLPPSIRFLARPRLSSV